MILETEGTSFDSPDPSTASKKQQSPNLLTNRDTPMCMCMCMEDVSGNWLPRAGVRPPRSSMGGSVVNFGKVDFSKSRLYPHRVFSS